MFAISWDRVTRFSSIFVFPSKDPIDLLRHALKAIQICLRNRSAFRFKAQFPLSRMGVFKIKKQGLKIQGYFPYKKTIPFTFPSRFFLLRLHQAINFSPNLEVMYLSSGLNLSPTEAAIPFTLTVNLSHHEAVKLFTG
jgi:hypothetical protein